MSTAVQQAPVSMGPTQSQLAVAYSVCRGITRSAAKNFYYAFLVLPKPKRQALCAVYAFMRRCDDIADDPGFTPRERRQKMAEWLDAVHRALGGHPTDDPVLMALTDSQRRYSIPLELLDQLAYGTTMDVPEPPLDEEGNPLPLPPLAVQYKTFQDLYQYCYHVASVVGLVCIRVFGYSDPSAEPLAEQVGLAFQLTNIIRDVKEDAALGRIYLPEEDLAKFGLTAGDLVSTPDPGRMKALLEFEADAPASTTTRARSSFRWWMKTASPVCGCSSPSTGDCWKRLPPASTTSSLPASV